ncbi:MAG: alanine:cation symporter family protein, partial [Acutalibacteraceae bacterium]
MKDLTSQITIINSQINSVVWGTPMLMLIIFTGVYITVRLNFFQVKHYKHISKETFFAIFTKKSVTKTKNEKAISQFQSLTTALASTIGTGNIAGVATAVTLGGPGAVFWMWFSAFFGMMTIYSENVLGIYYRQKNENNEWAGGPMYYIKEGLCDKRIIGKFAKPLSFL